MSAQRSSMLTIVAVLSSQASVYAQTPCPTPTLAQHSPMGPVSVPGLAATLRTDRREYHVGDPILLQLTTENHGCETAYLLSAGPDGDFSVQIIGPDGQAMRADPSVRVPNEGLKRLGNTLGVFPPRSVSIESYDGRTWTDLRAWHFELREAGSYWITAVRRLSTPEIRTNTMIITIQ